MAAQLESFYKDLNTAIDQGAFDTAVNYCDKILAIEPTEFEALHCKVLALVHSSKYDVALKVFDANPELKEKLASEYSYCLYRTGSFEALKRVTSAHKSRDAPLGLRYLTAQAAYRLGDYEGATDLYRDIMDAESTDAHDLKANYSAALIASGNAAEALQELTKDQTALKETFELSFNAACALLAAGNMKAAKKQIDTAMKICKESLSADDVPAEEIEDELAIMRVQLAYIEQLEGKTETAMEAYNTVIKSKPSDQTVAAVAANNLIGLKKDKDLFDSFKKMKAVSGEVEQKLLTTQQKVISENRALLLLHMGKLEQCREVLHTLRDQYPDSEMPCLISAALHAKQKKFAKCEDVLKSYIAKHSDSCLRTQLTLAQIQLNESNTRGAIETLKSIDPLQHKPGMVATLVSLFETLNDIEGASKCLNLAVEYWENKSATGKDKKVVEETKKLIMRETAKFKAKYNKHEEALAIYEKLLTMDKKDFTSMAGLVISAGYVDVKKAEKYDHMLPPIAGDPVDAEMLEGKDAPSTRDTWAKTRKRTADPMEVDTEKPAKRKKKKKPRLPKNFDPSVQPDPERWLPRRERTYGKKLKAKKGQLARGPQGATAPDTEKSAAATPAPAAAAPAPEKTKAPPAAKKKRGRKK
eukprot:GFYU01006896.1.p1 GENE.GFYU01006896.1~~GFYU01006896.1.p1  ORF type:complete len:642 (+),score=248.21 GFYU01006896.1:58-1983(+)